MTGVLQVHGQDVVAESGVEPGVGGEVAAVERAVHREVVRTRTGPDPDALRRRERAGTCSPVGDGPGRAGAEPEGIDLGRSAEEAVVETGEHATISCNCGHLLVGDEGRRRRALANDIRLVTD